MRVSSHQLEAIVRSSCDGITVQDRQGSIVFANDVAAPLHRVRHRRGSRRRGGGVTRRPFRPARRRRSHAAPMERAAGPSRAREGREIERRSAIPHRRRPASAGGRSCARRPSSTMTGQRPRDQRLSRPDAAAVATTSGCVCSPTRGARCRRRRTSNEMLPAIARLIVPAIADYCLVDRVDDDGTLHHVVHVHADPDGERTLDELRARCPVLRNPDHPVARVVASGKPLFEVERPTRRSIASRSTRTIGSCTDGSRRPRSCRCRSCRAAARSARCRSEPSPDRGGGSTTTISPSRSSSPSAWRWPSTTPCSSGRCARRRRRRPSSSPRRSGAASGTPTCASCASTRRSRR